MCGTKADITAVFRDVGFWVCSGRRHMSSECPFMTQSGHERLRIVAVDPHFAGRKRLMHQVIVGVVLSLGQAMRRRDFIKVVAGSGVWPLALTARAQQPERMRRIALLMLVAEKSIRRHRQSLPHLPQSSITWDGPRVKIFGSISVEQMETWPGCRLWRQNF